MQYINAEKLEKTLNARLASDIQGNHLFGASLYVSQNGQTIYQNSHPRAKKLEKNIEK